MNLEVKDIKSVGCVTGWNSKTIIGRCEGQMGEGGGSRGAISGENKQGDAPILICE